MTIDKEQLKALALEQPVKEWTRSSGRTPCKRGPSLMYSVEGPEGVSDYEDWGFTRAAAAYIAAANPATILALLDEIERLSKNPVAQAVDAIATAAANHLASEAKGCLEKGLLETIEQVKAENEALHSQVAKLQAEPDSYQSGFDAGRAAEKAHADNWRAEADGLRKDAERYRYVRDCAYGVATIDGYRIMFEAPMPEGPFTGSAEKLDLAVDTDMSQEAGQ